jgi:hypothetical protein
MTDPTAMTPGERRDLKAIVRARINLLVTDVKLRESELMAEAEARLTERFAAQDRLLAETRQRIRDIAEAAAVQMGEVMDQARLHDEGRALRIGTLIPPHVSAQTEDRTQLRRAMEAGVKARVKAALLDLERQRLSLLEELTVGAITSDEGKGFLGRIPSAAELVPSSRLAEIEAAFDAPEGP